MNDTPQQNQTDQNVTPVQPPVQPVGQGLGSPNPQASSNKTKMILVIILAVVVLVGAGVAYWMLKPAPQATNNTQQSATQTATTRLTNELSGSPTVAVTHPASWEVTEDSSSDDGLVSASKTITSVKGNALKLHYSELGVGGSCESDSRTFTLTQKLSTATPGIYFTEYTVAATASEAAFTTGFKVDATMFDIASKEIGAKGTNVCDMAIGSYSKVGGNSTEDDMFITVTSPKATDPQNTQYADIADDTDFIAMLQSLKVTTN